MISQKIIKRLLVVASVLIVAGCMQPAPQIDYGLQLEELGFTKAYSDAVKPIYSWSRIHNPSSDVHIYIEGDGRAWGGRGRPSLNPTPRNPTALHLAIADSHRNVIYIARPCQFVHLPVEGCHFSLWTTQRYSRAQVESVRDAILDHLKHQQSVVLIGFSGGGYLASQLAQELPGVSGLVTVAGNLEPDTFADFHRLPKPVQYRSVQTEKRIPQLHLTGSKDKTIPPGLTKSMIERNACVEMRILTGVSHSGPWMIPWEEFESVAEECRQ